MTPEFFSKDMSQPSIKLCKLQETLSRQQSRHEAAPMKIWFPFQNINVTTAGAKPAHRSQHAILGSKSGPSRIGNRIKESALLGKHTGWHYVLTGDDESWFYFTINPDHGWVPEGAVTPTQSRQAISSPKQILTVFWSPRGFPLVQILPKRHCFNVEYFYRVSHSGLASEDLCGRTLGWTLHHIEKTFLRIIT
jgi:hypothetical protein